MCKTVCAIDSSISPRYQQLTGLVLIPRHTHLPQTLLNRRILNWLRFVPSRHTHKDKKTRSFFYPCLLPILVVSNKKGQGRNGMFSPAPQSDLAEKNPQEQSSKVTVFLFLGLNFHARLSLMSGSQSLLTLNPSC